MSRDRNLRNAVTGLLLAAGVALPGAAQADPDAWSCGGTEDFWCFNCAAANNMDNSNSCASHAGRNKDDWTLRMRSGTAMWIQIAGDPGSDMKMAGYASIGSVCNSVVGQSSSSPGWGSTFDFGFAAPANQDVYIAIEELDDRTPWYGAGSWGFELTKTACCPDNDGDGTYAYNSACNSMPAHLRDCNDSDGTNSPIGYEVCDGRDNDCDNSIDEGLTFLTYYRDNDGDGYGNPATAISACSQPTGYVTNRLDCDDTTALRRPGRTEDCDGLDNDCDDLIDEGLTVTFYRDFDGDEYGDANTTAQACPGSPPRDFISQAGDCDDNDAQRYPGLAEYCDSKDNDCNGLIDDGAGVSWYADVDEDGYGNGANSVRSCTAIEGRVRDDSDCDDADNQRYPGLAEVCDGKDNDCNNSVDDGVGDLWYVDADGDGHGTVVGPVQACSNPGGRVRVADDCDDSDRYRYPGYAERCDGKDNDCDNVVDEETGPWWNADLDGDGYGDPDNLLQSCSRPDGYLQNDDDCDDSTALRRPGLAEVCDELDNDCDDLVDNNASDAPTWYADSDADGFGDAAVTREQCAAPSGFIATAGDCDDRSASISPDGEDLPYDNVDQDCSGADLCDVDGDGALAEVGLCGGNDCADGDASILPGAEELADGVDNNCDGRIDEGTENFDDDRDGWTEAAGDCDDTRAQVFPGAQERCTGYDSDCDGEIDEGTACRDDDGDGASEDEGDCNDGDAAIGPHMDEVYGNGLDDDCDGVVDSDLFDADADGVTEEGGDCDDNDATTWPGAPEVADGADNDCDGTIDEGTTAYDDDGDGFSEADGDCDDTNAAIHPDASEVPNGRDDDCNGITDDRGESWDDDGDGLSEVEGDCDDGDPSIRPGAEELSNGIDDDCDGEADEGITDLDRDGYAVSEGDCDDDDGWTYPGAEEMCGDRADNNCNGQVDEGCDGLDDTGAAVADPTRCGCQSTPTPVAFAPLLLLGLLVRRRRS